VTKRNAFNPDQIRQVETLLRNAVYPIASPLIAHCLQLSGRQTMRVLKVMEKDGLIAKVRLPGEGNRGTAYEWVQK
jgi:hypothetical protein